MRFPLLLLLVCSIAPTFADNQTTWAYPPGPANATTYSGLNIRYGDTIYVDWTSTYPSSVQGTLELKLWCGKSNLQPWNRQVPPNGTWPVPFTNLDFANWPLPLNCFFSLDYNKRGNGSTYFVLNDQDPNLSSTTWSYATSSTVAPSTTSTAITSSTSTSTPDTNSGSTTVNSPVAAPSSTATGIALPSGRSDSGTKTRVVVGCTVGSCIGVTFTLGMIYIRRRRRRRRREKTKDSAKQEKSDGSPDQYAPYHKPELAADQHPPQVMPLVQDTGCTSAPYELPLKHRSYQELPIKHQAASIYEMPGGVASRPTSSQRPVRKDSLPLGNFF